MRIRCFDQHAEHPRIEKRKLAGERNPAFAGGEDGNGSGTGNAGLAMDQQMAGFRRFMMSADKIDNLADLLF